MAKNIVYVLGAGFSKAAGLPLQRELLPEIMKFEKNDFYYSIAKRDVEDFISENFHTVNIENLTLEDLFTILDKAVLGKEYFGGYGWQSLYKIRKGLVHTLLILIDSKMKENKEKTTLYSEMCRFIINNQLKKDGLDDNIKVISLNWDTIFESVINTLKAEKKVDNINFSYGVFTHSLKGKNTENVLTRKKHLKIIKLHGSINWQYCPNCGRLFIDKFENIGINHKTICPNCPKTNKDREIILEEMIITPTMLKEYQNHHLKLSWQQAFIELSRADIAIFIGYSFLLSDYELRYLFKKALSKNVKLEVILHKVDETNGTKGRYENFFGSNVEFNFDGFEEWWQKFHDTH
jgi:NAD-dependent SIR2 family protein deacetylase